jgi:hypothetical protein
MAISSFVWAKAKLLKKEKDEKFFIIILKFYLK